MYNMCTYSPVENNRIYYLYIVGITSVRNESIPIEVCHQNFSSSYMDMLQTVLGLATAFWFERE